MINVDYSFQSVSEKGKKKQQPNLFLDTDFLFQTVYTIDYDCFFVDCQWYFLIFFILFFQGFVV